ncbi:MAG: farnesyl diphosphate synthase [Candidatus Tokpelaia sp. JSC189]|nr:MAG: farnesyl diphosphate synthase [Candidatus Tokpelaia sp. JSC189]
MDALVHAHIMQDDHSFSVFETILQKHSKTVEALLGCILSANTRNGEIIRPARLLAAVRHGVFNGGKRLRPFLVMESTMLFDARGKSAVAVAAALECVHCYSLIHDDLPAMDDDDLRRGKPTVHKAFDEATAILAGDALLTLAFDILADEANGLPAETRALLVLSLARASGIGGMVGGQALDIVAEQRKSDEREIILLQVMKTGALLRFACEAGAVVANASMEDRKRLAEFGRAIGLAFQLADDLLDVTEGTAILGKTAGKDITAGKATLVAIHGVDWIRHQLDGLIAQANEILQPYGQKADILRQAALFVSRRKN